MYITLYLNKSSIRETVHNRNCNISDEVIDQINDIVRDALTIACELVSDEGKKNMKKEHILKAFRMEDLYD